MLMTGLLLVACGSNVAPEDDHNLLTKFNSTWNIYEKLEHNDDGSVTYNALPWGGLVGSFMKKNLPVDLSEYESITFVFDQPTSAATQIMVSEKLKTWGKAGISSLTCEFDGQDVHSVDEIVLQASDTCTITVSNIYMTPNDATWESTPIWIGNCEFDNWQNGFVIDGDKFNAAEEGDKLEFIFSTDTTDPNRTYWLFKTIYSGTDETLEGNDSHLNEWGCASVGKQSTAYRIVLTAKDVVNLREKGLFVNGFYCKVTQCNLLRKTYGEVDEGQSAY